MKSKLEIVREWLPEYTGKPLDSFGHYILLTKTSEYVEMFARRFGVAVEGLGRPLPSATAEDLTILDFGAGSAMAATVMDLLAAVGPRAVLFLGRCGGLKKARLGDFVLPIAAIRGDGASNAYIDPEVPALPSFRLQKAISAKIVAHGLDYWTGTVYTTSRRVWEHDPAFREYLRTIRAEAIDMETATIFTVGFVNRIPKGALLMVTDKPLDPGGIESGESARTIAEQFAARHLDVGIDALIELRDSGESVKHLRFD